MHPQRDPVGAERLAQPVLPAVGVGGDAGGQVHFRGAARGGDLPDLPGDRARAHDQPPAAPAQRGVEVGQAVGEEGGAVGHVEAGGPDPGVADEQGHHRVRRPERGVQGRMVVQAQVRGEQDDRDGHGVTPGAAVR